MLVWSGQLYSAAVDCSFLLSLGALSWFWLTLPTNCTCAVCAFSIMPPTTLKESKSLPAVLHMCLQPAIIYFAIFSLSLCSSPHFCLYFLFSCHLPHLQFTFHKQRWPLLESRTIKGKWRMFKKGMKEMMPHAVCWSKVWSSESGKVTLREQTKGQLLAC